LPPRDEPVPCGTCCRPKIELKGEHFTCPKPKRRRNKP
jgi:hypothetical protein